MAKTRFDISQTAMAKLFGVTPKAVQDALKTGKLTEGVSYLSRGGRYYFDAEKAKEEWIGNSTERKIKFDLDENSTLNDVKKALARTELEKKTIELAKLRGELVEASQVYSDLFEFGQKVRQRIQAVPKRIVDDLLAADSRVDAMRLLTDAISDALSDLSDVSKFKPK